MIPFIPSSILRINFLKNCLTQLKFYLLIFYDFKYFMQHFGEVVFAEYKNTSQMVNKVLTAIWATNIYLLVLCFLIFLTMRHLACTFFLIPLSLLCLCIFPILLKFSHPSPSPLPSPPHAPSPPSVCWVKAFSLLLYTVFNVSARTVFLNQKSQKIPTCVFFLNY